MIFGCPREEWKQNEEICRTMCEQIKLYDANDNKLPNHVVQRLSATPPPRN
jgi:hypothetical protein